MIRIGRLRPIYALQLQHAVTSNLSRVGTQRPPSVLEPRHLRCYVGDGRIWKLLYKGADKDDAAVAELAYDDETYVTYILSDPALHRILENLRKWLADNLNADKKDALSLVNGDSIAEALQGYRQKVPKPVGDKHDVTAFPLEEKFEEIGKVVAFVPFRKAPTPFVDVRNASKCKKERDTRLLFVFGDDPSADEPADKVPKTAPADDGQPAEAAAAVAERGGPVGGAGQAGAAH